MSEGKSLELIRRDDGIAELRFDRKGETVNKLDRATFAELTAALDALDADAGLKGVLVTSGKDVFIVGADIFEFTAMFAKPPAETAQWTAANSAVVGRFAGLAVPVAVAINGFALGGGLEVALAADYRVMSAKASIGLPEVTLGLIPGYGGTVRLPRVANDLATALAWITGGKPQNAQAALALGVVDEVAAPEELTARALAWLARAARGEVDVKAARERRAGPLAADPAAFEAARAAVAKTNPHVPAARLAVDSIEAAAALPLAQALAAETQAFASLFQTQAAHSLIRLFINDQAIRKLGKGYAKLARPVRKGAVLGAGIMGGGISYVSALRGTPVIMKDIAQHALDLGISEASKLLAKQVAGGRLAQDKADAVLASITPQLDYKDIATADVIIEAVVENLKVKKAVLGEVEGLAAPQAVLASNTSSLSIGSLAEGLKRPENFVGMHFFNPVPAMPLVEVIKGPRSSDVAAATAAGYALAMGKTPIVVKDCAGFLVNRILIPSFLGFSLLVRDGVDFQEIDRVMEGKGWPMGPAFLQDVIGNDTTAHVIDIITGGYGARMELGFRTPAHLMLDGNRLGQKNGIGFYRYEADPKGRPRKQAAEDAAAVLAPLRSAAAKSFTREEIFDYVLLPMVTEAARCLEDGIAGSPAEIDMSLILGLGFPRHVGGVFAYADWRGLKETVAACDRLAAVSPIFAPPAGLRARAERGEPYYA